MSDRGMHARSHVDRQRYDVLEEVRDGVSENTTSRMVRGVLLLRGLEGSSVLGQSRHL